MVRILWFATTAVLVAALFILAGSLVEKPVLGQGAPLISASPTVCPVPTMGVMLAVEPLTSPTELLGQTIDIFLLHGEAVTVTLESGIYTDHVPPFDDVPVGLLPNTTHHLHVQGLIGPYYIGDCEHGPFTISTSFDRYGNPLTIEQIMPQHYPHYLPLVGQAP